MTTPHPDDDAAADAAWTARAQPCDRPFCDVFVRLAESVYIGPADGMTPEQWRQQRIALPPHGLPCRLPGRVASADLPGREAALAAHYAALAGVLTAQGRHHELARPFPYLVLQPAVLCGTTPLADWPWSDSRPEAEAVLRRLAQAGALAPGEVLLDDEDQGWRLRMKRGTGDALHLVEWDAEGPPPPGAGWRLPAAMLAEQAAAALQRLRAVHAILRRQLPFDPWP